MTPNEEPTTGSGGRRRSRFTALLRYGFSDPATANRLLSTPEFGELGADAVLLEALGNTADPDLAVLSLLRLVEAQPDGAARATLLDTLRSAKPLRDRLLGVLGASEALGDHLAGHPDDWRMLAGYEASDLHPGVAEFEEVMADVTDQDQLRVAYRRVMLTIAARDVCGTADFAQTAAELSDLATATLRKALALAEAEAPDDAARCRLAVIAMGKAGGRELNYVSDVDVIFVGEPVGDTEEGEAVRAATRLASHLMRICSDTTVEGTIWPVDANLRPEGRNGPLVRTFSSHLAYYQRWAKTWEFQALLKARRWSGRSRSATTSSPTCRRCAAGSSPASPSARWTGSSSSAREGCELWSSPCSCSSWYTAAETPACAAPPPSKRWTRWRPVDTWADRTPPR